MYDLGRDSEPGAPLALAVSGGNLFVMKTNPSARSESVPEASQPDRGRSFRFDSILWLLRQAINARKSGPIPDKRRFQPLRLRLTSSTLGTVEPIIAVRDLGRELLGKPAIGRREFALLTQGSKNIQPLFVRCPGLDPILDSTPT